MTGNIIIKQEIIQYLQKINRASITQIYCYLQSKGFIVTAKYPKRYLSALLHQDKRFYCLSKIGRWLWHEGGGWTLNTIDNILNFETDQTRHPVLRKAIEIRDKTNKEEDYKYWCRFIDDYKRMSEEK